MKKMNVTLMLLLLAVISFAQVPSYVPTNGLVGWWPFNGNANDESGNGNNGTVNGATLTADRFGNAGKAYSFDGVNDFIEILHNNIFNLPDSMSFNFWINSNDVNAHQSIINKASAGISNSWIIQLSPGINDLKKIWLNCGGLSTITQLSNPTVSQNNIWYNIIVTYDRQNVKFYINGVLDNMYSLNSPTPANTQNIKIGGLTGEIFNGEIDDIGIWNRALDSTEVAALYNANICYQLVTVTDTLLINTGSITGFNPLSYENTIKIWPNPSNSQITIDAGDLNLMNGYSIRIVNALGQQMFQTALTQQQYVVNLATWTGPGLYYVNIINPQGVTIDTKKIVIQ
jgi:hypothetical protein